MTQAMYKTGKLADPSVVHPSNPKSDGQNQDVETATELCQNAFSTQISESSKDIEAAYQPLQRPLSRHSDPTSTIEINDPTNKLFRKTDLVTLEVVNIIYILILIVIAQKNTDSDVWKNVFSAPSVCHLHSLFYLSLSLILHTHLVFFLLWGHIHTNEEEQLKHRIATFKTNLYN